MSDQERGAYTPPTDAPLSFDARQPVRGSKPLPLTLILSVIVLVGLAAAIFVFYRSGVREAGQAPQTVGEPLGSIKAAPPAEAQPQDPAAGLQIYRSEANQPAAAAGPPQFIAPPETPQPRPGPSVVIQPPAPAPTTPVAQPRTLPPALAPAPVTTQPAVRPPAPVPVKPAPALAPPPVAKAAPVTPPAPKPAAVTPPAAAAKGGPAGVQIGAYSSQALADKGWNDAAAVAPGAAAGKGKRVEQVEKDGHTLFRTTVTGFASRDAASAFCNQLKAAGKSCFVK